MITDLKENLFYFPYQKETFNFYLMYFFEYYISFEIHINKKINK